MVGAFDSEWQDDLWPQPDEKCIGLLLVCCVFVFFPFVSCQFHMGSYLRTQIYIYIIRYNFFLWHGRVSTVFFVTDINTIEERQLQLIWNEKRTWSTLCQTGAKMLHWVVFSLCILNTMFLKLDCWQRNYFDHLGSKTVTIVTHFVEGCHIFFPAKQFCRSMLKSFAACPARLQTWISNSMLCLLFLEINMSAP